MTDIEVLLSQCSQFGVVLAAGPDGQLRASPPGKLPDALKRDLRKYKQDVLTFLTGQQAARSYRDLYRQKAEDVQDDCSAIDPVWLIATYPSVWIEMKNLDTVLNQLEGQGEKELYQECLGRLVTVVQKARKRYDQEQRISPTVIKQAS